MIEDYEEFSEPQLKILERFVTHLSSNIFVLHNLPEVLKGALFSRYSRSSLGLRSLLLKEFILSEETAFSSITGNHQGDNTEDQIVAIKKAQNFYDRILDGFGDDSIGELGGAHLAVENISMLGANLLEDARIGGSPLEKSTRYVYFDQKVKGEYLFYREPVLMTSAYRDVYLSTCNLLFDTYSRLVPPLTALMEQKFPREEGSSKVAYTAALRAKVLDCLRGLLPAGTLTNMGMYGNGRFFESLLQRLNSANLAEMQDIGKKAFEELGKVIPSFIRRAATDHRHYLSQSQFEEAMHSQIKAQAQKAGSSVESDVSPGVTLIDYDPGAATKVATALLFEDSHRSWNELKDYCASLSPEELNSILDAACNARETRRHKSPRALEHAVFTFEIVADYGIFRDLHRHRLLTQERQLLTCDYGYFIPMELQGTEMESDYVEAMERGRQAHETIARELPEEAQYVVPMAYHIRWYFHVNLRSLQWICELRSQSAGHPNYRQVAQMLAKRVVEAIPAFERFFQFVDYGGYDMGRLGQEQRKVDKLAKTALT